MKQARFLSSTLQTVAANENVQTPAVTSNTRAIAYDNNGGIIIKEPGDYKISAVFELIATDSGTVEIAMFSNGERESAAKAGTTFAATSDYATLPINALKTVHVAENGYATIEFKPNAQTSVNAAYVIVEKVE